MVGTGGEIVTRIECFRGEDEPEKHFARRIGVGLPTLRQWALLRDANRDVNPRLQTIRNVADKLGVTLAWLLTGEGPKEMEKSQ